MTEIRVFDDVLPEIDAYRAQALALAFGSVSFGPVTFHGIAAAFSDALPQWIAAHCPDLPPATLSFFRQSPQGQVEPNYLHTDCDMGLWTAVLYLNPDPAIGDGTVFWRERQTGATGSRTQTAADIDAWRAMDRWEPIDAVDARYNRVVLFPAERYHSRAIRENYGSGDAARLTQVVFGGQSTWQ